MRILLNCLRAGVGGNSVYISELLRGLDAHDDVELVVACSPQEERRLTKLAPTSLLVVRPLAGFPLSLASERSTLKDIAMRVRPDVVHDPISLLPFLRLPFRSVVTIHDLNFLELSLGAAKTAYKRALYAYAARHADLLLCISTHTYSALVSTYPAARERAKVLWQGQPYGDGPDLDDCVRDDPPYLLTFAHRRHKNAEAAVRVLGRVRRIHPSARLKIVGGGVAEHEPVLAQASRSGLEGAIDLCRSVTDSDLEQLYRRASFLVFLSSYEGFGLPVLEAMVQGCPVVTSDRGSLPEVVGSFGRVVGVDDWEAAADYVLELLGDEERMAELRRAGQTYARRWTWGRTVDGTVECYRALVNDRATTEAAAGASKRWPEPARSELVQG